MKSHPRMRLLGSFWNDSVACCQNICYPNAWSDSSCRIFMLWQAKIYNFFVVYISVLYVWAYLQVTFSLVRTLRYRMQHKLGFNPCTYSNDYVTLFHSYCSWFGVFEISPAGSVDSTRINFQQHTYRRTVPKFFNVVAQFVWRIIYMKGAPIGWMKLGKWFLIQESDILTVSTTISLLDKNYIFAK